MSFVLLSSFQLYDSSMRADLFRHLSSSGGTSKDWKTDGDEETGLEHIHVECATRTSMVNLLMDMVVYAGNLSKSENSQKILDHLIKLISRIEGVLDQFRDTIAEKMSDQVGDSMKEYSNYLSEIYTEILQKARYGGVTIISASRVFAREMNYQMSTMIEGLYEEMVLSNSTVTSARECMCDLLLTVDQIRRNHSLHVQMCADNYALQSIRALNNTSQIILKVSEDSMNAMTQPKKIMKESDAPQLLTKQVRLSASSTIDRLYD